MLKLLNSHAGRAIMMLVLITIGLFADRMGVPYAREIVLTTLTAFLAILAGRQRA